MGSFPETYNDPTYLGTSFAFRPLAGLAVTNSLSVWIYVISQWEIEQLGIFLVSFSFCFL